MQTPTKRKSEPSITPHDRALALLAEMTLEEKVAQTLSLTHAFIPEEHVHLERGAIDRSPEIHDRLQHGIGSFPKASDRYSPRDNARFCNALQQYVKENTRLGIPVLIQEECLCGLVAQGATSFPVPLALAGCWDEELVEKIYAAIAAEARSRGTTQTFTPVFDLLADPRWGRSEETFGEDTWLVTRMGCASVRGFQGTGSRDNRERLAAVAKAYVGYSASDGGRNFAPSNITPRLLADRYLPPFAAAIREGLLGIMPSHNEIDGVPLHADRRLLTEVLRGELGFQGVVVSDYCDIDRLHTLHLVADSKEEAAVLALEAGVDLELPYGDCYTRLGDLVRKGTLEESVLDTAVLRILTLKYELGLFENPWADEGRAVELARCSEHEALSREAADKSLVLLKNEKGMLPLAADALSTVAVIGPNAAPVYFGGYSPKPNRGTGILEGIRTRLDGVADVVHAEGVRITREQLGIDETELDARVHNPQLADPEVNKALIQDAVLVAQSADVVVLCIGGTPLTSREAVFAENDRGDRAELDLPGDQAALVDAVLATGTPVVAVLIGGRPLAVPDLAEQVPALFQAWYLGQETGHTVAAALFGDINPSGKLAVTMPRGVGHLPVHYSQKPTGRSRDYLFEKTEPVFPFGYGLSYTEFRYGSVRPVSPVITAGETAVVQVDITNTGTRKGDEVVQMYIRDQIGSVTRPVMELRGFRRITLAPGETRTVTFEINEEHLAFTRLDGTWGVEPGLFDILVGPHSAACKSTVLEWVEKEGR